MFLFSPTQCRLRKVPPLPQPPLVLWPDGAPGALGKEPKDIPTLTPFLPAPETATGAAMVVCPGGGYGGLAPHEGDGLRRIGSTQGIAGFVLKYRLGSSGYRHPRMLEDAARAMRLVRFHAAEWKMDPQRLGIIGSSAGGHLASTLLTHFDAGQPDAPDPIDRVSCRPDLGVLCYPVITMGEETHHGSRDNLLGKNPSPALIQELSNELHVTTETPPCFIFHTSDDAAVPVENSLEFAAALRRAGCRLNCTFTSTARTASAWGRNRRTPRRGIRGRASAGAGSKNRDLANRITHDIQNRNTYYEIYMYVLTLLAAGLLTSCAYQRMPYHPPTGRRRWNSATTAWMFIPRTCAKTSPLTPTSAWPGSALFVSTDATEEDDGGKIRMDTVFDHHYFDWEQDDNRGGAKLLVSPRGEGVFRMHWQLDRKRQGATSARRRKICPSRQTGHRLWRAGIG